MISIKDVANHAGVSIATASRALNGNGYCSEKNKKKILAAAKELDYIPNQYGKALKDSENNVVGIIISDTSNEYYWTMISLLEDYLKKIHYNLMTVYSSEDPKKEEESFKTLISYNVSIILFTPTCSTNLNLIKVALANGTKVIQIFRKVYNEIGAILNSDDLSTYLACEYLYKKGYHKMMLLDVNYAYLNYEEVIPKRSEGIEKFKNLCEYKVIHIDFNDYDKEAIINQINSYKPDSIICATNVLAMLIIDMFNNNQISKDIAFITFDDNIWFKLFNITTIKQNSKLFVEKVIEVIRRGSFNDTIFIDSELVSRKLNLK